jgi:hypothetical protein
MQAFVTSGNCQPGKRPGTAVFHHQPRMNKGEKACTPGCALAPHLPEKLAQIS